MVIMMTTFMPQVAMQEEIKIRITSMVQEVMGGKKMD